MRGGGDVTEERAHMQHTKKCAQNGERETSALFFLGFSKFRSVFSYRDQGFPNFRFLLFSHLVRATATKKMNKRRKKKESEHGIAAKGKQC